MVRRVLNRNLETGFGCTANQRLDRLRRKWKFRVRDTDGY